jgi:outer membrane scaffolding protein for murein synthesis (MipA/OmpV family)
MADQDYEPSPSEGWEISAGAGVMLKPEFAGSEDYEFIPLPLIDARWKDRLSLTTREGVSYDLLKSGNYKAGIGAGYDFGRDENDGEDNWLDGMGDIDPAVEARVYGEYGWRPVWLEGEVRTDAFSSGHEGWLASAGVKYRRRSGQNLFVSIGPSITWASEDYMESYFGVDASQAAGSRFGRYNIDSGIRDYSLDASAVYNFRENWYASGFGSTSRLLGDAGDSPLVQEEAQYSIGAGLGYRF